MVTRKRVRSILTALGLYVLAALLIGYFGVNAFSEAVRQELLGKRVRVGVVAPGTVDTEIFSHLDAPSREAVERQTAGMVKLRPDDVADAVLYMVTRAGRVAVNHMLVRASDQTW